MIRGQDYDLFSTIQVNVKEIGGSARKLDITDPFEIQV
jgi:hypothetical protein